jgi:alpha-N-arabinofuranosidase
LDFRQQRLVGPHIGVMHGSRVHRFESPRLYRISGRYVLMTTETGPWQESRVLTFTSENLKGPYMPLHAAPVLANRSEPGQVLGPLQRGDMVQTHQGQWWGVCLGVRKVGDATIMGHETFLAPMRFADRWPVVDTRSASELLEMNRPLLNWHATKAVAQRDEFAGGRLSPVWNVYRTPEQRWWSLLNRTGWLRMKLLAAKPTAPAANGVLARRVESPQFWAQTRLAFKPRSEQETAGLIMTMNHQGQYSRGPPPGPSAPGGWGPGAGSPVLGWL